MNARIERIGKDESKPLYAQLPGEKRKKKYPQKKSKNNSFEENERLYRNGGEEGGE